MSANPDNTIQSIDHNIRMMQGEVHKLNRLLAMLLAHQVEPQQDLQKLLTVADNFLKSNQQQLTSI